MTYNEFISRFEVFDNPPLRKGFDRHHIVPVSEQEEPDNRQIYLTPTQHMWAHILYDREHGTKTAMRFLSICGKPAEYFDSFEKCFAYFYTFRKKREIQNKKSAESMTIESRKKRSETLKGRFSGEESWMYGKHRSEETRKKMSESLKGNTNSKGMHWYNNGIKSVTAYSCPDGFVKGRMSTSRRGKRVQQFTKEGLFISEYSSTYEASRQTGVAFQSIGQCCLGKQKSAGGFIWRYV